MENSLREALQLEKTRRDDMTNVPLANYQQIMHGKIRINCLFLFTVFY